MKPRILYSHWSAPATNSHAGFNTEEDLKIGISTSILLSNKFYDVILVIDKKGWELVEPLQLPISELIITDFDEFGIPTQLWNFGKIRALQLVEGPVIHLDYDVFLHKPLPEFKEILLQNLEGFDLNGHDRFYGQGIHTIRKDPLFHPLPYYVELTGKECVSVNCGVFGFQSDEVRRNFTNPLMDWLNTENVKIGLHKHKEIFLATTVEQIFFTKAIEYHKWDASFIELTESAINANAVQHGFTHLLADSKRKPAVMEKLKEFYCRNFPTHSAMLLG